MLVVNFGVSGIKVRLTAFLLVFFFYSLPAILIFLRLKGQVLVNCPVFSTQLYISSRDYKLQLVRKARLKPFIWLIILFC